MKILCSILACAFITSVVLFILVNHHYNQLQDYAADVYRAVIRQHEIIEEQRQIIETFQDMFDGKIEITIEPKKGEVY